MLAILLLLLACEPGPAPSDDDALPGSDRPLAGEPASAFSLEDVNVNSATFGQPVSPGDYAGEVSAWYFGHST